jgi:hypothetical protein
MSVVHVKINYKEMYNMRLFTDTNHCIRKVVGGCLQQMEESLKSSFSFIVKNTKQLWRGRLIELYQESRFWREADQLQETRSSCRVNCTHLTTVDEDNVFSPLFSRILVPVMGQFLHSACLQFLSYYVLLSS